MRTMGLVKAVSVTLFLVLIFISGSFCAAAKVMYDNTIDEYAWWAPLYDDCVEVLDYGYSGSGDVGRFIFGYVTTRANPGRVILKFYRSTDDETCPGYEARTFIFNDLPGSPNGYTTYLTKEVVLEEDYTFKLYNNFGYSFQFDNDDTGVWLARGGAGNDDGFWGCFKPSYDWYYVTIYNAYAGCYMKLYEYEDIPPIIVQGYKFDDTDGDAAWDEGEIAMPGWEIYADINKDGNYDVGEPNMVTDPNGHYELLFTEPGTYEIREVLQDGWTQTLPGGSGAYTTIVDFNDVIELNFGNCSGLLPGSINGLKFNDLDRDGIRDGGEPGLADWEIYLDLDDSGMWEPGEPKQLTNQTGYYEFEGLNPGIYTVGEVPQDGWVPTLPGWVTGNVYLSRDGMIMEYTSQGVFVREWAVPDIPSDVMYQVRDMVVDAYENLLYVYNGTFEPVLSIYDFETGLWSSETIGGLSTVANSTYGGIAKLGDYVFLTDMNTSGAEEQGIVRFDTTDSSYVRFAEDKEIIDLNIGLDGLLYVLSEYNELYVYDPTSFALLMTQYLTIDARAIAANECGTIFIVSWGGNIYRLNSNGDVQKIAATGFDDLSDINLAPDGTIMLISTAYDDIVFTDESLNSFRSFGIDQVAGCVFGTFAAVDNTREATVIPGDAVIVDFGNRPEKPTADFDYDFDVDEWDLVDFVEQWLQTGRNSMDIWPFGDDGRVDLGDFCVIAEQWLTGV